MIRFIKTYLLDILNLLYFHRVVNKFTSTPKWKELKLRKNLIGEIYTVVRLRDEDLGDPDEIITTRLMEISKEANIFISQMDVQFEVGGLVTVDYYHIPKDPNAFLMIWQPKLQVLNIKNTIKFSVIVSIITISTYAIITYIMKFFNQSPTG